MIHARWAVVALAATFAIAMGRVDAKGLAGYITPQPDSPVKITGCGGHVDFESSQWGTTTSTLITSASFKDAASKTAVAVLIAFRLTDAFGDVVGMQSGQSSGTFSPNTEIDGQSWNQIDQWPALATVGCSVARVLFDDGSTWNAPPSDPPTARP